MARLATLMRDDAVAASARQQAVKVRAAIEREYYDKSADSYAFSRNPDGTLDHTASIFPAVAWWNGTLALENASNMLSRWASPEFSTDWGTRDISDQTPFYDPISYHQGSVWPLFTGWVSLAEYRAGRALSGYAHLMQNAGLTWAQDLGAVTELLSGEFFQPLGRSSSHQIWSSAMVLTPSLRGLFGLDWDAPHHTLRLAPHLPASWDSARLRNVPLADLRFDLEFTREGGSLKVRAISKAPASLCLIFEDAARGQDCNGPVSATHEISEPLPEAEIELPRDSPLAGARTSLIKPVDERRSANAYEIDLEAPGGAQYDLPVRLNRAGIVANARITGKYLHVRFPEGPGYQRATVRFSW
jgi:hypothetical protein